MTKDNTLLDKLDLTTITPSPRGVPQINVCLVYDANKILKVGASNKCTGNRESITITNVEGTLTQDKFDSRIAEAPRFAEEDKATPERIQARNRFANYVFSFNNEANDDEGLTCKSPTRTRRL